MRKVEAVPKAIGTVLDDFPQDMALEERALQPDEIDAIEPGT